MKLPKTLCVKFEKPENDEGYFVASQDIDGMVEMGEEIEVGVYKLIETKTVEGVVEVKKKRAVG